MKLQSISACLVVCLSMSLHAMEERADSSKIPVWAEIIQPGQESTEPEFDVNPSEEYPSSGIQTPLPTSGILTPTPEKLNKEAHTNKLSLELGLYLDQYTEDDTYGDIPENERRKFQDDEREWNKNLKSYYNRCKIYEIQSAKKRYDIMKEHYRQKKANRTKMVVLGGATIVALVSTGFLGRAYLNTSDRLVYALGLCQQLSTISDEMLQLLKIVESAINK